MKTIMYFSNSKYMTAEKNKLSYIIISLFILSLVSCSALIAPYNEVAYQNATNLKVESLAIMDKATGPYDDYQRVTGELMIKLKQAYEYSKGIPKNQFSAKQWEVMIDPDGGMIGGFIEKWKTSGRLNETFVIEAKGNVEKGFEEIIKLESAKIKN